MNRKLQLKLLSLAPLLMFALVVAIFSWKSNGAFIEPENLLNILTQSSAIGIVATGMTFVLLTAGVDLSVGSIMFVAVAVAGKMIYEEQSIWLSFLCALGVGLLAGGVNAFCIVRFRIVPFVVTLAMLFIGRGFGLWITNTRAMNMPDGVTQLGAQTWLGIPVPMIVLMVICVLAQILLSKTPLGRQIYALGKDIEAARKAGVPVAGILILVYLICGFCAALSGLVSLSQTGAVSPTFGNQKEFMAIAAAVLGGTSLFGGRGNVLPGTLMGAVLIQTVQNGLVILNANPYIYPLVTSAIIFAAVLVDNVRGRILAKLERRLIRMEEHERIQAS